jgi:hypothetical protein
VLAVTVRDGDDHTIATGIDLEASDDTPITRLRRRGEDVLREDIWPGAEDIGQVVLLPGGEVGRLLSWWNAEDHSEWRWQIELYNHR